MKSSRVLLLASCAMSTICLLTFVTSSMSTSIGKGKNDDRKMEVAVMPDQQQFTNPGVPVIAVRTVSGLSEPDANAKKQYLIKEVIVENRSTKNVSSVTIRWIIAPINNRTTTLARGDFKPHVMQSLRKTLQAGNRQTLKLSHPRLNQLIEQVPNRASLGEKFVFLIGVAEVTFEDGSSWKEELTEVITKSTTTN